MNNLMIQQNPSSNYSQLAALMMANQQRQQQQPQRQGSQMPGGGMSNSIMNRFMGGGSAAGGGTLMSGTGSATTGGNIGTGILNGAGGASGNTMGSGVSAGGGSSGSGFMGVAGNPYAWLAAVLAAKAVDTKKNGGIGYKEQLRNVSKAPQGDYDRLYQKNDSFRRISDFGGLGDQYKGTFDLATGDVSNWWNSMKAPSRWAKDKLFGG